MDLRNPVLVIAGPTASGKSALAMDAAEAFDGTVINADSMQVYRELSILTARPRTRTKAAFRTGCSAFLGPPIPVRPGAG